MNDVAYPIHSLHCSRKSPGRTVKKSLLADGYVLAEGSKALFIPFILNAIGWLLWELVPMSEKPADHG